MKRRILAALGVVLMLLLFVAPGAQASTTVGDVVCDIVAGQNVCNNADELTKAEPPVPERPDDGMSGFFLQAPDRPPTTEPYPFDPNSRVSLYEESGLAGFGADIFRNPGVTEIADAAGNAGLNGFANTLTNIGLAFTGITSAIGDFVYDPTWLNGVLDDFATSLSEQIQLGIWAPFLGLALAVSAVVVLWRTVPKGNLSASWTAVLSSILVVAIGLFLAWQPLWPAQKLQEATSVVSASLGNVTPGTPAAGVTVLAPASANTEATGQIVTAIHYNGWLRRQLGSSSASCATEYGPALFRAQRLTWAQTQNPDLEAIIADKQRVYSEVAERMSNDPSAASCYQALQGKNDRLAAATLELAASVAANAFRIMAFLLVIAGLVALVILALGAVGMLPYLATEMGRGLRWEMAGSAFRAFIYSFGALLTSWGFNAYCAIILRPGSPPWVSEILLLVGTILAFLLLAPHRKIAALMPGNSIDGSSRAVKWGIGKLVDHWSRGIVAAEAVEEVTRNDKPARQGHYASAPLPREASLPKDVPLDGVVMHKAEPGSLLAADPRVIPGEVVETTEYRRMDETASAPKGLPSAAGKEIEIYRRTA